MNPPPSPPTRSALAARSRGPRRDRPSRGRRVPTGRIKPIVVLIVDDDAPSVKLLSVVLEAEGFVVHAASSAEEALVRLRSVRPDVIVLDLILPLMSGLLLAEQLKADPATADILLVAVTAFNGTKTERIAAQAGFSAYVRKPIDPASFVKLVFETLEADR
jgi:CheY-like chemotaxis protein